VLSQPYWHTHPINFLFTSCEERGSFQESHHEKWMLVLYHPICWELLWLTWSQVIQNDCSTLDVRDSLEFTRWHQRRPWPIFLSHFTIQSQRQKDLKDLKSDSCRTEFPPPRLGGMYFPRKVSRSQSKMMRRLLVYWHCRRHGMCRDLLVVSLKGFYPRWLRFQPSCCVQSLLHCCMCTG